MSTCRGVDCDCFACRAMKSDLPAQQLAAYKQCADERKKARAENRAKGHIR